MGFFKDTFTRGDKKDFLLNYDDTAFYYFIFVILFCIFMPFLYLVCKRLLYKLFGLTKLPLNYQCTCSYCTETKTEHQNQVKSAWFTCGFVLQLITVIALGYSLIMVYDNFGKNNSSLKRFDPYEILGIQTNATEDEIKLAYRRLARELHPDKNPDDPEAAAKFVILVKAYNSLSDEEGRRNYLRYGNPEGPGPLQMGIALPEFLIKKENQITVLVTFFIFLLVVIPGVGLYWYTSVSKYNKHGIYQENLYRYAPMLNENLPLKKISFVMAISAEFDENLTITHGEEPILSKVPLLIILVNEYGWRREAKEVKAKNI